MDIFTQILRFINDPKNQYGLHTHDFVNVIVIAVVFAILISLPLGFLVARRPIAAFIATNLSGLGRAIPTLAFLLAIAPLPHIGYGFRPTVIALTILGIPPMLLNTIAAIRGLDPAVVDSAKGMGMTPLQVFLRIEAPLALPVVAAGVRTSAVQIVSTAPLATFIGGGGYGDYIAAGISLLDKVELLAGAIPVALFAVLTELLLAGVQRLVTPVGLRVQQALAEDVPVGADSLASKGAAIA